LGWGGRRDCSRGRESVSGQELMERGFEFDVDIAAQLNVSENVPRLFNKAFVSLPV
jgi:phosphosulfolactate phosphohydrolase-like enzyme